MLGVIGGSGLYAMDALQGAHERVLETPFGAPSDAYICGTLAGTEVAFLPRHGIGHRIAPSELNFRANIHGFKQLGAQAIVSVSAVGSLREEIVPGHLVIPDQFIDRTRGRISTFFGDGIVAHVGFADPFCSPLSTALAEAAREAARAAGGTVHEGGTYVCMEGPAFSTRAESHLYRSWGGNIIGMTNLQEAKLAREAEICFATLALATDYDCWREEEAGVETADVLAVLMANAALAREVVCGLAAKFAARSRACRCPQALEGAVITDRSVIPPAARQRLDLILRRALGDVATNDREG